VKDLCLEPPEHAVLRAGFDADQIHQMDHDQEHAEHATNHHQTPRHLVRALVFLAHSAELALRIHAERNASGGEAQADDPVE